MRRVLLLTGGLFSLGLGIAGAVLPVLPATPFLLLASACFVQASPTWHRWLLSHPVLGLMLRDWELRGGVRRSVKVAAVASVSVAVGLAWWRFAPTSPAPWLISGLAGIGMIVVWRLPIARVLSPAEEASLASPVDCCLRSSHVSQTASAAEQPRLESDLDANMVLSPGYLPIPVLEDERRPLPLMGSDEKVA